MAMGKRIAVFLEVPEGAEGDMGMEYGYKLVSSTRLLSQLPE